MSKVLSNYLYLREKALEKARKAGFTEEEIALFLRSSERFSSCKQESGVTNDCVVRTKVL
jgi:hypothetical protein